MAFQDDKCVFRLDKCMDYRLQSFVCVCVCVCVWCVNACDVWRIGFVKKEEYICKIYIGIKFLVNTHDRGDNKQNQMLLWVCVCVCMNV